MQIIVHDRAPKSAADELAEYLLKFYNKIMTVFLWNKIFAHQWDDHNVY